MGLAQESSTSTSAPFVGPVLPRSNEDEWSENEQKKKGPILMFVDVLPTQPNGAKWNPPALSRLSDSIKDNLKASGVTATVRCPSRRVRSRK